MSDEDFDSGDVADSQPVEGAVQESEPQVSPEAQQQTSDYWSHFKGLPEFQGKDDRDIAAHLYQTMEREKAASQALARMQQVLPYAQDYMAHRGEFDAWRKQQQQQQQQPQQPQQPVRQPWQPPEIKDSYRRYLTKDENGRDVISEDAPLDARQALIEHMNYRADFAQKFLDNPEDALGPMIQQMAEQKAQEIVNNTFTTRENEAFVEKIERENADWLRDSETGQVTPEGFLVHKYIEQARDHGINGPQARWDYAIAMTERDMLARRFQEEDAQAQQFTERLMQQPQQPEPQPPVQAEKPRDTASENMEYLRREASRNPSRSAGRGISNGQKPAGQPLSFEQMLQQDLSNKGYI